MTNYVNLALEFKDVTKIRALPPDRDESKIIKYYMRFVINNICNDGKNLTHTMYTTNNSFDRMNSTNLYKKQVRRADAKFHYYVIVLNAPARVIQ